MKKFLLAISVFLFATVLLSYNTFGQNSIINTMSQTVGNEILVPGITANPSLASIQPSPFQVSPKSLGTCDTLRNWETNVTLNPLNGGTFFVNGTGTSGGQTLVEWAEKYTVVAPTSIKAIRYAPTSPAGTPTGTLTFNIYSDAGTEPGAILYSESVNLATLSFVNWNMLELTTPQNVSGSFWVGFDVSGITGTFAMASNFDNSVPINNNSYAKSGGNWTTYGTASQGFSAGMDVLTSTGTSIPTASFSLSNTQLCQASTILGDGNASTNYSTFEWTGFPGAGLISFFAFPAAGSQTIELTVYGSCYARSQTTPIVVYDNLSVNVGQAPTSCGLDNGILSGNTPTGGSGSYTYSVDGTNFQPSSTFTGLASGTYQYSIQTPGEGCFASGSVSIAASSPVTGVDNQVSCGPYTWIDGNTYSASNTTAMHTIPSGAANGCDSIVTLNLTVNNLSAGTDVITNCGPYTWIDGNTYSASNTTAMHTITGGAANGCDSIVTLNLTVNNPSSGIDVISNCGPYTWIDGNTYSASNGTATHTIAGGSANGCDSIVTLNLTVNSPSTGTDIVSACHSYTWIDGNTYSTSDNTAMHTITGGAANGCDSNVTLNLTITPATVTSDVAAVCPAGTATITSSCSNIGDQYYLYNQTSGTTLAGPIPGTGSSISAPTGPINTNTTFEWKGGTFQPGNAMNFSGITYANVPPQSAFNVTDSFSIGMWFKSNNATQSQKYLLNRGNDFAILYGYVSQTIEFFAGSATGDDPRAGSQIVLPDLNWHHIAYTYDGDTLRGYLDGVEQMALQKTFTLANNGALLYFGGANSSAGRVIGAIKDIQYWNIPRSAVEIASSMNSCISGSETGLIGFWNANEGSGITVADLGPNNANATTNSSWLSTNVGCSLTNNLSMGTTTVTTLSASTGTDTQMACDTYTWIDGVTYIASNNTATHTLTNAAGCDSIVTLNLTINNSTSGIDTQVACDTYTWIDGNTYTASNNTATHTLTNAANCDSTITLNLTINNSTSGIDTQVACDTYTWIDGNTYSASNNTATHTLTNAANCDSTVTLDLTINNSNTGTDTQAACGSYTWIDGNTYTASNSTASHTIVGGAANGCDSIVTLNLTITPIVLTSDLPSVCPGGSATITANCSTLGENYYLYNQTSGTAIAGPIAGTGGSISAPTGPINTNTTFEWQQADADLPGNALDLDGTDFAFIGGNPALNVTNAFSIGMWFKSNQAAQTNKFLVNRWGDFAVLYGHLSDTVEFSAPSAIGDDPRPGSQMAIPDLNWHHIAYTYDGTTLRGYLDGVEQIAIAKTFTIVNIATSMFLGSANATPSSGNVVGSMKDIQYWNIARSAAEIASTMNSCISGTETGLIGFWNTNEGTGFSMGNVGPVNFSATAIASWVSTTKGCSTIGNLNVGTTTVNVLPTSSGTDTQVHCDPYTWIDGNIYTASNSTASHTIVGGAANGCDSIVTLNLTINNAVTGIDTQVACDSFTWIDGNTYTASNNTANHTIVGGAANGCDSIVTLNLTINNSTTGTDTQIACDTYTWIDGNTYTASNNTATHTLTNAANCDSTVTLNLTINNSSTGTDTQVACDTYTWIDGNTYTASNNTATHTLTNAANCDSTVTLNLTVNNSNTGTDTQVACNTYTWIDGNTYTTSNNTATHTVTNTAGCDSTVTLNLTINNSNTGTDTQVACNSYTWIDGNTYAASNNTATHTLTNAAGCDSVVTLNLTINNSTTGTDTQIACDTFTWIDGNTYSASNNMATHILTNAAGCDSVVTLNLTINSTPSLTLTSTNPTTCGGSDGTITISGSSVPALTTIVVSDTLTASATALLGVPLPQTIPNLTQGHYEVIVDNGNGCPVTEPILILNDPATPPSPSVSVVNNCGNSVLTATGLAGATFNWSTTATTSAITVTSAGTFFVAQTVNGCSSLLTAQASSPLLPTTGTDVQIACETYTWIDGNTYTASNNSATHTLTNAAGCDSTVTLNLTINNSTTDIDTQIACDTFTWIDGNTYTASNNTATHILTNAAGCDSVVTLNLTINSTPSLTLTSTNPTTCGGSDGTITISGSSVPALTTIVVLDTLSAGAFVEIGVPLPHTFPNLTQGHYEVFVDNGNGCPVTEPILILNDPATPPPPSVSVVNNCGNSVLTATGLAGATFDWSTMETTPAITVTSAGTYLVSQTVNGCSSLLTAQAASPLLPTTGTDVQIACGSYMWIDSVTYTTNNNTATHVLTNAAGCDSTVSLDLTFPTIADQALSTVTTDYCDSASTTIDVASTELGITYSLIDANNGNTIGSSIPGTGSGISFPTGNITNSTTFGVVAEANTTQNIGLDLNQSTYSVVSNSPSLTLGNQFTVECNFMTKETSGGWYGLLSKASYVANEGFMIYQEGNILRFTFASIGTTIPNIQANQWYHLAMVYNNGTILLYLDGQLINSFAFTHTESNSDFVIGARNGNTGTGINDPFSGAIDEVRLWNITRSTAEIQTSMNDCVLPNSPGLIGYWKINEGAGSTLIDETPNSNNGTIFGSPTTWIPTPAGCNTLCPQTMTDQVTLNIGQSNTGVDTQVACETYTWIDGNTYTASNNTATHTLTNAAGCDSTVTLNLTINNSNTGVDSQVACDTFTWIDGITYTSSNSSAMHTITNAVGCDSTVTLNLTIINSTAGIDTQVACNTYTWIDGNTYTASNNTATHVLTNSAGCDSTVTLNLTINNSVVNTSTITVCDSFTWPLNGTTYTSSTIDTIALQAINGCDSLLILDLTLFNSTSFTETVSACGSYTWPLNGATYTMSGAYADTLSTGNGCDSIVTLDLTINQVSSSTDVISACGSYTWIDGITYVASNNTATHTLTNSAGCDSIVTLDLTINSVDVTVTNNSPELIANATGATYQWVDCDNGNVPIAGETNQAFTTTTNGNYAVIVTQNGCTDTSQCILVDNVGVNDLEIAEWRIYPNPSAGIFHVESTNGNIESYQVFAADGRLVLSEEIYSGNQEITVDLSGREKGVYFFRGQVNGKTLVERIVLH